MKEHHAKKLSRTALIPKRKVPALCKHCGDRIRNDAYCEPCERYMTDQCCACHDELVHDKIKMQNVNTLGGRKPMNLGRAHVGTSIELRRRGV